MASKYAHLKGKVPEKEKTDYQQDVTAALKKFDGKSPDELTKLYNEKDDRKRALTAEADALGAEMTALGILIRRKLNNDNAEALRINGYTWSMKFEPYPQAEDPEAIKKYFRDNGMEDQLELTNTELAGRLKKFVKAEADNNELTIEQVETPEGTTTVVKSQIPGVKVFLDTGLSRVKSGKGA